MIRGPTPPHVVSQQPLFDLIGAPSPLPYHIDELQGGEPLLVKREVASEDHPVGELIRHPLQTVVDLLRLRWQPPLQSGAVCVHVLTGAHEGEYLLEELSTEMRHDYFHIRMIPRHSLQVPWMAELLIQWRQCHAGVGYNQQPQVIHQVPVAVVFLFIGIKSRGGIHLDATGIVTLHHPLQHPQAILASIRVYGYERQ